MKKILKGPKIMMIERKNDGKYCAYWVGHPKVPVNIGNPNQYPENYVGIIVMNSPKIV